MTWFAGVAGVRNGFESHACLASWGLRLSNRELSPVAPRRRVYLLSNRGMSPCGGSLSMFLKVSHVSLELPLCAHYGKGMLLSNRELPPVAPGRRVYLLSNRGMSPCRLLVPLPVEPERHLDLMCHTSYTPPLTLFFAPRVAAMLGLGKSGLAAVCCSPVLGHPAMRTHGVCAIA